ncbi:MAG TPA: ATP-binding protein, partial [Gallionella sp.]|nr:ATP-binding protein [Gallionella sp.]
ESEHRLLMADGRIKHVHERGETVCDADGRLVRALGMMQDITDLKRYEAAREAALAEAERLAKQRSEFLSHMSHELRTPLNGILGHAQILQRDKTIGGQNAAALNVIRESGEHLLALIDDILDLARIESGKMALVISDIPLPRFLHVVAEIVAVRARQKGVEFSCELASDLPECIRGDDKRLRQVLLNLLSNAVKFTERGRVTLRVSLAPPSRLVFAVEDTGIGIAENELERIFHPFEQTGNAQHRLGGTGLGLAISRQLVRLMGGDIAVESRAGHGSTFRFELELPTVECAQVSSPERAATTEASAIPLIAPPPAEMQELHRLALLGNMRDIVQYAERIGGLDPRYLPFAARLRQLAEGYQSRTILAFVEQHWPHP